MSLFHTLLHFRPIHDAAVEGRGYVFTFGEFLRLLRGGEPEETKISAKAVKENDPTKPVLPVRWTIIDGKVLDLDRLAAGDLSAAGHPGGQAVLKMAQGRDASVLFNSVHALAKEDVVAHWFRACTAGLVEDFPELAGVEAVATFSWNSPLAAELRESVREHFKAKAAVAGVSLRQATKASSAKWALILVLWASFLASFVAWLSGSVVGLMLLPFLGALATFHSFHDASHGALSSRAWVNEAFAFSGFLIGAPHEWYWQHVAGHHTNTNIADGDPDSKHARRWVAVQEGKERPPLFAIPAVWTIAVPVGLQVLASFRLLARPAGKSACQGGVGEPPPPSAASLAALVLQRFVFYVLPFCLFGFFWGAIWVAYPAAVFSLLFMLNTQLAHLNDATDGEAPERRSECWYAHQIATSADFAPTSTLHWFLSGGLNLQLEHHLFPTIDHSHLMDVRRVVERVCAKHGVQIHTFDGYTSGFASHLRHLGGSVAQGHTAAPGGAPTPGAKVPLSSWYSGRVWHKRRACQGRPQHARADHDLTYDVQYAFFDLDELEEHGGVPGVSPSLLGYGGSSMSALRFNPADHFRSKGGASSAGSLANCVRELVKEQFGSEMPELGAVRLLTMPRRLGYVFNPLSVYYIYDLAGQKVLAHVLEVSNTPWGEEQHYVLREGEGKLAKKFHVSPFQPMDTEMDWTLPTPGERLTLRCSISRHGEPFFEASACLFQEEFSTSTVVRNFLKAPLHTYYVQWAIHQQAWFLFRKGCTFFPHPKGTKTGFSRTVEFFFHKRHLVAGALAASSFWAAGARVSVAALIGTGVAALISSTMAPKTMAASGGSGTTGSTPPVSSASGKTGSGSGGHVQKEEGEPAAAPDVSATNRAASLAAPATAQGARPRVCIVGSGIAGNGAAYWLRKGYEVTVVEREERTGGHAHTVQLSSGHRVDIGFQVFNFANYPLLTKLFDELDVASIQSDMSLSVAGRGVGTVPDFEWSSKGLFPTWGSIFDPRSWRRVFEILRFEKAAAAALASDSLGDTPLKDWLQAQGFSEQLREEYLAPMSAALWSCPTEQVLDFPAVTVFGFMSNHFMLQRARPKWRTVQNRSEEYVRKLHEAVRAAGGSVRSGVEVARLEVVPQGGGVRIFDVQGRPVGDEPFDYVVLAVHTDQAMQILRASTLAGDDLARAEATLGKFRYFANEIYVHSDPRLMPRSRSCWSAWNALQLPGGVSPITYWINKLQPGAVPEGRDVFVTLNPPEGALSQEAILSKFTLDHPILDRHALAAQRALPALQGLGGGRLLFCGAWAGHGFHEDGLRSAAEVCKALGADLSAWSADRRPLASVSAVGRTLWSRALAPGLQNMVSRGTLRVIFGDGSETVLGDGTGRPVELRVLSERFLWRVVLDPGMALSDAYEEGEVDVRPDIIDLFNLILANKKHGDAAASPLAWSPLRLVTPLAKRYYAWMHARRANSHAGSQRNIAAHYDLSNAMFGMFLSRDMTYSAGIFDDEVETVQKLGSASEVDFLELAQYKKLDRMLDLIELEDGDTVLEIGCGWGSMAIRGATRCPNIKSWTAITISRQQLELASARVAAAGLSHKIRVVFCDYRDAASTFGAGFFSKVVSCEMIEAVGHEFLPGYFAAIDECLKPGGRASIQAICVPDGRYESYLKGSDFIRERIFPGSSLLCLAEIERACEKGCTSLVSAAPPFSVGLGYAKTLREWRRRFAAHEAEVREEVSTFGEGFDDKFMRRWHYYFAYCEAGFQTGHIDDWQICLRKEAVGETGSTASARKKRSFDGDALHAGRAGLLPLLREALTRPGTVARQLLTGYGQRLLDRGALPDWAIRAGIRMKLAQKIREESTGCVETDQAKKLSFIEALHTMPIAICTKEANEQHYEVPPELYHLWLGPRKKYSGCIYPEEAGGHLKSRAGELLPAAEERALQQYVERAGIEDGMAILDLGCGWGSCSLFLAERFPNALIVGVSNSHGQRGWILGEAKKRGLTNVRIATCDVSQTPIAEAALPLLKAERPEAAGFDRAVSVEMMEHMKNYDILLERVAAVLRPGGRLFVHIFVHTRFAYHFVAKNESDWMARYFFAGGTMPSADLLFYFQRSLKLKRHWHVNGRHYQLTAEGWLQNTDHHKERIMELLKETYPEGTEVMWFHRWRAFFMACAELWGYNNGNEWIVAHYLFEKPE